jgi:hypothetical protein
MRNEENLLTEFRCVHSLNMWNESVHILRICRRICLNTENTQNESVESLLVLRKCGIHKKSKISEN